MPAEQLLQLGAHSYGSDRSGCDYRQALASELVRDGQELQRMTSVALIVNEVIRPHLVGSAGRPRAHRLPFLLFYLSDVAVGSDLRVAILFAHAYG
jgi:hypothetical protein